MHAHRHTHSHTHTAHTRTHTRTHAHARPHAYTHTYTQQAYTHIRTHTHTHTHTYTSAYTHIHAHTHAQKHSKNNKILTINMVLLHANASRCGRWGSIAVWVMMADVFISMVQNAFWWEFCELLQVSLIFVFVRVLGWSWLDVQFQELTNLFWCKWILCFCARPGVILTGRSVPRTSLFWCKWEGCRSSFQVP